MSAWVTTVLVKVLIGILTEMNIFAENPQDLVAERGLERGALGQAF